MLQVLRGNIGQEIIRGLKKINTTHYIVAADFNTDHAKKVLHRFSDLEFRTLDFSNSSTFNTALKNIDIVFLLRPPQLADIPKYFTPFVDKMIENRINHIVFLSVQGVENQKIIPHHKLEKLILDKGLEYVFLRPSYFMQNLSTTLLHEIKTKSKIFIPSGKLKFTWVDTRDIGLVGAHILNDFMNYKNQSFEITGNEYEGFQYAADQLTAQLDRKITYESPNLLEFYFAKRKQGIDRPMIFVMIMLHWLPRFSKRVTILPILFIKLQDTNRGNYRILFDVRKTNSVLSFFDCSNY